MSSVVVFYRFLRISSCRIIRMTSSEITQGQLLFWHGAALELFILALMRFLFVADCSTLGTNVVITLWVMEVAA